MSNDSLNYEWQKHIQKNKLKKLIHCSGKTQNLIENLKIKEVFIKKENWNANFGSYVIPCVYHHYEVIFVNDKNKYILRKKHLETESIHQKYEKWQIENFLKELKIEHKDWLQIKKILEEFNFEKLFLGYNKR